MPSAGAVGILDAMRSLVLPCALVAGCGFSGRTAMPGADAPLGSDGALPDSPPPPNTIHRRRIDITDMHVIGGPHADFPLLVSHSAAWLRTIAAGGDVAHTAGFDIVFTADPSGTSRLAHEVELYRGDTGTLVAWVKVPSLSPTTELYLHYGDPAIATSQENVTAAWSNGYAAVWHLHGGFAESSGHNPAAANNGSLAAGGRIAEGRSFDGLDDFIDTGSAAAIDDLFVGGGTVEAWFRADTWGEGSRGKLFVKSDASASADTSGWSLGVDDQNLPASILFGHATTVSTSSGYWSSAQGSVGLGAWIHVAVVYDQGATANEPTFFINGMVSPIGRIEPPAGAITSDAAYGLRLGNRGAGDRAFDGLVDEIRLSTVPRSLEWIATQVRNHADPAAFSTIGPEL